jgi:hypothetical protein
LLFSIAPKSAGVRPPAYNSDTWCRESRSQAKRLE